MRCLKTGLQNFERLPFKINSKQTDFIIYKYYRRSANRSDKQSRVICMKHYAKCTRVGFPLPNGRMEEDQTGRKTRTRQMVALTRAKMVPRVAPEDGFLAHLKCIEFLSAILCTAAVR